MREVHQCIWSSLVLCPKQWLLQPDHLTEGELWAVEKSHSIRGVAQEPGRSCSSVTNYFFHMLFCSWHPGLSLQWFVVSLLWLKSGARHMASYVKMPARMGWRDKLGQTCTYCNCLSSLIQAVQETKVVLGEPGQWKCEHTFIYSCQRCVWLQDCGPATSHCTWHPPSMGSAASFLGDFHTCPDFTNSITADCACS